MDKQFIQTLGKTSRMPVLFIGHGSPMNGIEDNLYTQGWINSARDIPRPQAILIISAHWETRGTKVFAGEKPEMIYDMYGFPRKLYEVQYPAPGSPSLALEVSNRTSHYSVAPTHEWGLDHGAWSVLTKMFPEASIPCFQLSLNTTRNLQWHYDLAKELAFLRERGVLIMGSGNIVHNLRFAADFNRPAADWALEFDDFVEKMTAKGDHKALIEYQKTGTSGLLSVNSAEHYIPMLYCLALQSRDEPVSFFNHELGNSLMDLFMRCLKVG